MSTEIDLDRTSGLVSLGTHTFQVTERSTEQVGDAGPYWRLICKVISPGDDQGKEVMYQLSLSPQSRFRIDSFLDGIGAPRKGKGTLAQFIGKKFRASIEHAPYQGQLRANIATVIPAEDLQQSFDDLASEPDNPDAELPADVLPQEEEAPKRKRF